MSKRNLSELEIEEAFIIFGSQLDYASVRIVEQSPLARLPARLSMLLSPNAPRRPAPAMALGNLLLFPVRLKTSAEQLASGSYRDMAWLIHELTHAWQYQQFGWRYLPKALAAHRRHGRRAYSYGGEEGVRRALASGRSLASFNPEQQGELARDYYLRVRQGAEPGEWEALLGWLRTPGLKRQPPSRSASASKKNALGSSRTSGRE